MIASGLLWFSQVSAGGSFLADILGPSVLAGVGAALAFIAGTIAATTGASDDDSGLASGLLNTSQQVGGAIGVAAIAAIATARTESVLAAGERVPASRSPRATRSATSWSPASPWSARSWWRRCCRARRSRRGSRPRPRPSRHLTT